MKTAGTGSAADFLPPVSTLPALRQAASGCRGCGLYRYATQTVFGEGPARARLMLVGEQPGDQEDRAGHPFVGPSGRLLDEALEEAGIDRDAVYVTNAVKHFKFVRQELTRRRLHKKPAAREVRACRPWLEQEVKVVRPVLIVALGSTAAQSLLGPAFRVTRERGRVVESPAGPVSRRSTHRRSCGRPGRPAPPSSAPSCATWLRRDVGWRALPLAARARRHGPPGDRESAL